LKKLIGGLGAVGLILLGWVLLHPSHPPLEPPPIVLSPTPAPAEGAGEPVAGVEGQDVTAPPVGRPTPAPSRRVCPYKYRVSNSVYEVLVYEVHALANRGYEFGRACDDFTQAMMVRHRKLTHKDWEDYR
jgi:hypothetical protein